MALKDFFTKAKEKITSWRGIFNSLKGTHRLVIVDDETLKESFSFRLTGINVFVGVGASAILLVLITIVLIAFTPIREYIPGYANQDMVEQTYANAHVIDSLEHVVASQEELVRNIQAVLIGDSAYFDAIMAPDTTRKAVAPVDYTHSKADSLLRSEVESKYNLNVKKTKPKKRK